MEVKAENQTTINKSLFSEGMLRISRDPTEKPQEKRCSFSLASGLC